MKDNLVALLTLAIVLVLTLSLGIFIGKARAVTPGPERHTIYIIDEARVDDITGPRLRLDYSIDGLAQTVFLKDERGAVDKYRAYLEIIKH